MYSTVHTEIFPPGKFYSLSFSLSFFISKMRIFRLVIFSKTSNIAFYQRYTNFDIFIDNESLWN